MNILVCVKQVPDLEAMVVEADANGWAVPAAFGQWRMNRFDEFAVEAAVHIKETLDGVHVDVVTAGPEPAEAVLRRAMGMGADEGIHLLTPPGDVGIDARPGPEAVAAWIAETVRTGNYRLILCGTMSEDGMHGMVGPMTAARLNLPYATQVIGMNLDPVHGTVSVEREIEGGARERLDIRLPALLALQPGINRPRYPALSKLLRANGRPLQTVPTGSPAASTNRVTCLGLALPKQLRSSRVITGSSLEKADQLAALLNAKAFL